MPLSIDNNTVATLSIFNPITNQYIDYNMVDELRVNENTLESDMIEHSSKYAYFSAIANKAENFERSAEVELETVLANAEINTRKKFAEDGITKPTVGQISAVVNTNEDVIDAKKRLSEAKGYTGLMKYILKAFDARKDLLINISAQRRKEMELTGQGYRAN